MAYSGRTGSEFEMILEIPAVIDINTIYQQPRFDRGWTELHKPGGLILDAFFSNYYGIDMLPGRESVA